MDIVTWYSQERDWYNSYTKKMEDLSSELSKIVTKIYVVE